ncbi:hypothetical protein F5Y18DRAFT_433273 [Xylariaceae sp. FL1019]|nr:hypothetical protein F5Y18DRAFT_433273 [Xylariaceae sp. FL1019]
MGSTWASRWVFGWDQAQCWYPAICFISKTRPNWQDAANIHAKPGLRQTNADKPFLTHLSHRLRAFLTPRHSTGPHPPLSHTPTARAVPRSTRVSPCPSFGPCTPTATIQSPKTNQIPTPTISSDHPPQDDLNFDEALSFPSSHTAVTIPATDFPVFTTDSNQSPWLPSSSPSHTAPSSQSPFHQQDFLLFDPPQPAKPTASRKASPASTAANFGSHNTSTTPVRRDSSLSPALQNQRVQQIIQATGPQFSPSALTNQFNSPVQNQSPQQQFYASRPGPLQTRPARPPVPLFSDSLSSQQTASNMDLQGISPISATSKRDQRLPKIDALEDFNFGSGAPTAFSPAISSYDVNARSTASSTHLGTVSPDDLFLADSFTSAPNSTALTDLTTPSDFGDYELSPFAANGDVSENWFSLFPDAAPTHVATRQSPQASDGQHTSGTESRHASGSGLSPTSPPSLPKASTGAGVTRRPRKLLKEIIIDDPNDTISVKRARNTLAARKSRDRKAQVLDDLEASKTTLTAENQALNAKVQALQAEIEHWKSVAATLQRSSGV